MQPNKGVGKIGYKRKTEVPWNCSWYETVVSEEMLCLLVVLLELWTSETNRFLKLINTHTSLEI